MSSMTNINGAPATPRGTGGSPFAGVASSVTVDLVNGQHVAIVVDSYQKETVGTYVLNATDAGCAIATCCGDGDLGTALGEHVAVGSTVGSTESILPAMRASCAIKRLSRLLVIDGHDDRVMTKR